jgi:hypothetical protein
VFSFFAQLWYLVVFLLVMLLAMNWRITVMMWIFIAVYGGIFMFSLHFNVRSVNFRYKNIDFRKPLYLRSIQMLLKIRQTAWSYMFILTLVAWLIVYLSGESLAKLEFLNEEKRNQAIFLGYWLGLLYPMDK